VQAWRRTRWWPQQQKSGSSVFLFGFKSNRVNALVDIAQAAIELGAKNISAPLA
jgi:hypothetical protein